MTPRVYFAELPPSMALVIDGDWLMVNTGWFDRVDDATVLAHLAALLGENPAVRVRGWGARPRGQRSDLGALMLGWRALLDDAARTRRGVHPSA